MITPLQFKQSAGLSERSVARTNAPSIPFSAVFERTLSQETPRLRFSGHALERLSERGITLTESDQARIEQAVNRLAGKGARESLVIVDQLALVVSVPNRTVITVVPADEMNDTVFTNIDSAVVAAPAAPSQRVNEGYGLDPLWEARVLLTD